MINILKNRTCMEKSNTNLNAIATDHFSLFYNYIVNEKKEMKQLYQEDGLLL